MSNWQPILSSGGPKIFRSWQQELDFARHQSVAHDLCQAPPGLASVPGRGIPPARMNPERTMTKQTKLIAAKADHGHELKGATKPARMAKATDVQPKTGRGVELAASVAPTNSRGATQPKKAASAPKPPRKTKAAPLRARLAEPGGVSLAVLMVATGWQAHTLRAALSGLRKTGMAVRREGIAGVIREMVAPNNLEAAE